MKIRCKVCGEFFIPDNETAELVSDGYIDPIDNCDECWEMINQPPDDFLDMYSDADPGL